MTNTVKALALSTLFAAGAASANDNGTNGTVVCDSTNSTNLVLVEVRTTNTFGNVLGDRYVEMDVLNRGPVQNVTPLIYSIYLNDAQGNPIQPAIETKQNPFAIQPQEYTVRFFYTNAFGTGTIPNGATFRIDFPCDINPNDNEVSGPVPGTITNPLASDDIFRDGFETHAATAQTAVTKALANGVKDGVISASDVGVNVRQIWAPKAPALRP